jgi:hypothetical protein
MQKELQIEGVAIAGKSEKADFYLDFSLKLMSVLKEKVHEYNTNNKKKTTINQLIEQYSNAASSYIKDESIDINTYSMAKVNSFLNGSKVEIGVEKAKEELKKSGLEFDFGNLNNLYIASPKDKCNKWYEI